MSTCRRCNIPDTNDILQLKKLNKIISNNYAILLVFLLLLGLFGLSFYYIVNLLYSQVSLFFRSQKKKSIKDDDEYYDDMFIPNDMTKYYDAKKKNFIKDLNTEYKEYNEEKTKQIKNNFNLANDDIINEKNIFFNKYDDY